MCRFGWYPLLVTPIILGACGLALFSSVDCEYMRVNVGFQPTNDYWNKSENLGVGFWFFQSNENNGDEAAWRQAYLPGCQRFDDTFEAALFENDSTWSAARVAAMVSACASGVAFVTSFLLNICPLPVCFIWPGLLLPSVMTAMFAEAIKFLAFDSDICKARIWADENGSVHSAENCTLSRGAQVSLTSIAMYFVCVVLICFKSPHRRTLDPDYGKNTPAQGLKRYDDLEEQNSMEGFTDSDDKSLKKNFSFEANSNHLNRDSRALSVNVMRESPANFHHTIDTSHSVDRTQTPRMASTRNNEPMTPKTNNTGARTPSSTRSDLGQHGVRTPQSCKSNRSQRSERSERTSWTEFDAKKVTNPYRDEAAFRPAPHSSGKAPYSDKKKSNPYMDEEHEQQEQVNPNPNVNVNTNVVTLANSSAKKRPKNRIVTQRLSDTSSSVALTPSTQTSKSYSNYTVNIAPPLLKTPIQQQRAPMPRTSPFPSALTPNNNPDLRVCMASPHNTTTMVPVLSAKPSPYQLQQQGGGGAVNNTYSNYVLENTEIMIPNRPPGENHSLSGIISELGSPTSQARRMLVDANAKHRKEEEQRSRNQNQKRTRLETLFQQQQQENNKTMMNHHASSSDDGERTVQSSRTGSNSGAQGVRMY
jgi:hypothetical protein